MVVAKVLTKGPRDDFCATAAMRLQLYKNSKGRIWTKIGMSSMSSGSIERTYAKLPIERFNRNMKCSNLVGH